MSFVDLSILSEFTSYYLGLFLAVLLFEATVFITQTMIRKDEEYKQLVNSKNLSTRIFVYLNSVLFLYLLNFMHFVPLLFIFSVFSLIYIMANYQSWKEISIGYSLVQNNGLKNGARVKINKSIEGVIEKVSLEHLTLKMFDESIYQVKYSHIKDLQIYTGCKELKETITLSFREDPKNAKEKIEELIVSLNDSMGEYLYKNKDGENIKPFEFGGIMKINYQCGGYIYIVEALVKEELHDKAGSIVRYKLANMASEKGLIIGEKNLYYKTRSSNK